MSRNYSAHQFDKTFAPQRLNNWEVPKWNPLKVESAVKRPIKPIADTNGRLLPNVSRSKHSPWGDYKSTWQLPNKISRDQANEINKLNKIESQRWATRVRRVPIKQKRGNSAEEIKNTNDKATEALDFEYTPGDFTDPKQHHNSRDLLEKQKIDQQQDKQSEHELNDLYLEKHQCTDPVALLNEEERRRQEKIPHVLGDDVEANFEDMKPFRWLTDKPTERNPSPVIPAYQNFFLAKKMHQENLEHQPLPDCMVDQAFRRLQVEGHIAPGIALDIQPTATGVGVKTYKAGPTHCTKLKVFRPKTCGVVPKAVQGGNVHRPQTSVSNKPMGSMDLAICWDYRPRDARDEPKLSKHIDGSNGSAAPAVFTLVTTPRTPEPIDTGRSAGVFTNTFGEPGFFDKDILRRKTGFMQRSKSDLKCSCGTSPINIPNGEKVNNGRSKSASRDGSSLSEKRKRCKSSPNLSQMAVSSHKENVFQYDKKPEGRREHTCSKYGPKKEKTNGNRIKKALRMCQKVAPEPYPETMEKEVYKSAFKAGVPKRTSTGTITSSDSGCSSMSSGSCSTKVLVIPKPRNPYVKKNYDIDTLVPPFTSLKGGAGQGGYPEHWRLASVYQHAYKPIEQRRRPLLETVYK